MKFAKLELDDSFVMPTTEGTGNYMPVIKTSIAQVGMRFLGDDKYQVRVEPSSAKNSERLSLLLTRRHWKQPEDDGQPRFTTEVPSKNLSRTLSTAIHASRGGDSDNQAWWERIMPGTPMIVLEYFASHLSTLNEFWRIDFADSPSLLADWQQALANKEHRDLVLSADKNGVRGANRRWRSQVLRAKIEHARKRRKVTFARILGVKGANLRWSVATLQTKISKAKRVRLLAQQAKFNESTIPGVS